MWRWFVLRSLPQLMTRVDWTLGGSKRHSINQQQPWKIQGASMPHWEMQVEYSNCTGLFVVGSTERTILK